MNRRGFISLFCAGVAGIAIERAIPFGRVWSFPKEIAPHPFDFSENYINAWENLRVGSTIKIRMPQRFLLEESGLYTIISEGTSTPDGGGIDFQIIPALPRSVHPSSN